MAQYQKKLQELVSVGDSLEDRNKVFKELGGIDGIAKELNTDLESGIPSKEAPNFTERRKSYGKNVIPKTPPKSLLTLIWEGLQDKTLILLMISACISLVLGIWENPSSGWIEGTAILVAVVIVVSVTAGNDWSKERQFRKLNDKKTDKPVKVIRAGETKQVSIFDVNVGDIVIIDTGDVICADGIFISGYKMKTDESSLTGETKQLHKGETDLFLLSSTQVVEGIGKMLVIAVGVNSQAGITQSLLDRPIEETPLQEKLGGLADNISTFGMGAAALIMVSLLIKLGVLIFLGYQPLDFTVVHSLLTYLITSITIVVVAVPEGLPLAVTISLAYSMSKMLKDNNLVRRLEACETMGGATTICSDKTGTLTLNEMTVVTMWMDNQLMPEGKININPDSVSEQLFAGISVNSTATHSRDVQGNMKFIGNQTECALLKLADQFKYEYTKTRKNNPAIQVVPFSSERKRMSTVVKRDGKFVLYCKGASEIVLEKCTKIMSSNGGISELNKETRGKIEETIADFASKALRTLVLSFREFDTEQKTWDEKVEQELTFIGLVGIEDPVRPEVPDAVKRCQKAGIVVRMVTGDNVVTARNIAKKCGLLSEDGLIIEGPTFRRKTPEEQKEIAHNLQVMARSSPTDKHTLVHALKELGHVVAVTGDGTNDAPALKEADIGFSMGITGTDVAKEASAIILMDDNFASIVKAAMWGRNVYDSIRKFIQFQLTVNFVACILAFVGALSNSQGESPLKPVQLLWVNLIMDTLAALALATEEPTPALLDRPPYGRNDNLITNIMWINIATQAIYQLIVNFIVLYFGHIIFGVKQESVEHLTIVFNVFVLCQLFNEINCRKLHGEKNVLKNLFTNQVFVGVMIFTGAMQYGIVTFGGDFAGTRPLTLQQWTACLFLGALGLIIGFIVKCFPLPSDVSAGPVDPSKKNQ